MRRESHSDGRYGVSCNVTDSRVMMRFAFYEINDRVSDHMRVLCLNYVIM
jgi:hypothetical protein